MISRREFIKDLGLLAIGGTAARLTPSKISLPEPELGDWLVESSEPVSDPLTKEQSANLAIRLEELIYELHPLSPEVPDTIEQMKKLSEEIAPYFIYEGIKTITWNKAHTTYIPDQTINYPKDISEVRYDDGDSYFLVEAQSFCSLNTEIFYPQLYQKMRFNDRLFNPYSPDYKYHDWQRIIVITHEIGHFQGICGEVPSPEFYDLETAAQLATAEVLCAMSLAGNRLMFLPALGQIASFAEKYSLVEASRRTGGVEWYKTNYLSRLPDAQLTLNNFEEISRVLKSNDTSYEEAFDVYFARPYRDLIFAINSNDLRTPALPVSNIQGNIEMNSTKYFMNHLNEQVDIFKQLRNR